jgi:hypothetical protein
VSRVHISPGGNESSGTIDVEVGVAVETELSGVTLDAVATVWSTDTAGDNDEA